MEKSLRRFLNVAVLVLSGLAGLALAGCNTVKGVGQDIEAAAEGTERAISD
jgi:predicted small secreted protein